MSAHYLIHLPFGYFFFSYQLYICNHNDNYVLYNSSPIRIVYLWPANRTYLNILPINLRKLSETPTTHIPSEKHRRFFYPHDLALIWSLLVSPLVALKPPSAVCRPSSEQIAVQLMWPPKNAAVADVRICLSSKRPDCLNPFFKKLVKAPLWLWPTYVKPMKVRLASALLPRQSTVCWLVTDGRLSVPPVSWNLAESYPHDRPGQILRLWLSPDQTKFGLDHTEPNCSRFCPCRPYIGASGGYF